MKKIFISYSLSEFPILQREEFFAKLTKLINELGDCFRIVTCIEESDYVLALCDGNSPSNVVNGEISLALRRMVPVIAVAGHGVKIPTTEDLAEKFDHFFFLPCGLNTEIVSFVLEVQASLELSRSLEPVEA